MRGVLQLSTCRISIQTCLISGEKNIKSPLAKEYLSLHFLLRTESLMQLNPFNMFFSRYCLNFMSSANYFHMLYCFTKVREWFKISVSLSRPSQGYKSNSRNEVVQWIQFGWVKKTSHICIAIVLHHSYLIYLAFDTRYKHDNLPQAATMFTEERSSKIVSAITSPRVEFVVQNTRKAYRLNIYFRFVR